MLLLKGEIGIDILNNLDSLVSQLNTVGNLVNLLNPGLDFLLNLNTISGGLKSRLKIFLDLAKFINDVLIFSDVLIKLVGLDNV